MTDDKAAQKQKQSAAQKAKLIAAKNKKKSIDAQIEELRMVRRKILALNGQLNRYREQMSRSLLQPDANFKGDRRDKFDAKINDTIATIGLIEAKHVYNCGLIEKKIMALQYESDGLMGIIGEINRVIGSLSSEISSLLRGN